MSAIDWVVMLATLAAMIVYGLYKGRTQLNGAQSYLLADRQMPWYVVLLGVMATQASAITFLSAPGQAYTDGMRFVQYYFGLPLAMVVICVTFIPVYRKLKVFTAYQYLEARFDRRTRLFTAFLFLLSRGLSTGISIYAPSIIVSSVLGWNIYLTNVVMGGLLLVYTWSGGAKAVAHTQKLQFLVILGAMGLAGYLVVRGLPGGAGLGDALYIAGKAGKLNAITTGFDWKDRYNIWSGLIGGFFLALSYFGTDQSQVGRYLTGRDVHQSKTGLLLNGLVKIPMQFGILLIGALVFSFYSLRPAPLNFNQNAYEALRKAAPDELRRAEGRYAALERQYLAEVNDLLRMRGKEGRDALRSRADDLRRTRAGMETLRHDVSGKIAAAHYSPDRNDTNYIFLYFVRHALPVGVVGLLFAVIILASWGSISAALNALAASSLMDIHLARRHSLPPAAQVRLGRLHTLGWGIFCIGVAMFASRLGSLIEAVNILGSLFYGSILGIFLVAFYLERANGKAVFAAALIAEITVVALYWLNIVSFLWLNVIGAVVVYGGSLLCSWFPFGKSGPAR